MTSEAVVQVLLSGLLMGLIYALMAAGLSLIFGLMDVVNFAHGEFLMVAMYLMFGLALVTGLDPLVLVPIVVMCMFLFGAAVYLGIIRFAMRAKANQGMVQVFVTFGLGLVLMGLAQSFFSPDYRSIGDSWVGGKSISLFGIYLPLSQVVGALVSIVAFLIIWLAINWTDFGKALEATREDADAVSLVGIDKNLVFTLGWGYGSALVGLAGSIIAIFFYVYPSVGASFILIAFVTVALGGFGSVYGALAAGIIVGLVEASTAIILTPTLQSLGVYAVYTMMVVFRPSGLLDRSNAGHRVVVKIFGSLIFGHLRICGACLAKSKAATPHRAGSCGSHGVRAACCYRYLRTEHSGFDAAIRLPVAKLEHSRRLLRTNFVGPRGLFRNWSLQHRYLVHDGRCYSVVRNVLWCGACGKRGVGARILLF